MNWLYQDQNTDLIFGSNICSTTHQFLDLLYAQETPFFDKKEKIYVLWLATIRIDVSGTLSEVRYVKNLISDFL